MTKIVKVAHRLYRCRVCGHEQPVQTNHHEPCLDYCNGCSWKCLGFDRGHNSAQMFGHAYRRFDFVSDEWRRETA